MNHFIMASSFLIFSIYPPSPVTILGTLFSRGVVTFSDGEKHLVLITPDNALVYTADGVVDVRLHINKGTVALSRITLVDMNLKKDVFQYSSKGDLAILKNDHTDYSRQSIYQKNDRPISYNGGCISDENVVLLETDTRMDLESVILQAPIVALVAKQYNFNNCFCDAKSLIITSHSPNSLYHSIEFVFDKQAEISHTVSGKIDFETDSGDFAAFGIKAIKIQLSERAFASQGKPIPEIKPGGNLWETCFD